MAEKVDDNQVEEKKTLEVKEEDEKLSVTSEAFEEVTANEVEGVSVATTVENNEGEKCETKEEMDEKISDPEKKEESKTEDEKPKVYLHQIPATKLIPNLSPFCLKLETYLRMNNIPYENVYGTKQSKKGKVPWIEYKGERKADSAFIMEFLHEQFETCCDIELTDDEAALGRAIVSLIESSMYSALVYHRWVISFPEFRKLNQGSGIASGLGWRVIQRKIVKGLDGQGMGRHSKEEVYHVAEKDLKAFSTLLGDKKFILGEKHSSYDCSAFGLLANIIWSGLESPMSKYVRENCGNIVKYCERMKEKFWQDWDDFLITSRSAEHGLKKGFSFRRKRSARGGKLASVSEEGTEDSKEKNGGSKDAKQCEGKTKEKKGKAKEAQELTSETEEKPKELKEESFATQNNGSVMTEVSLNE